MIDFPMIYGFYAIDVGPSIDEKIDSEVYRVTNTETGVVEAETSSLPRAIMSTQSANMALVRLLDNAEPTLGDLLELEMELDDADTGTTH
jgi:hypothetical protein